MKLIDDFLTYEKGRASSDKTIFNYSNSLHYFFQYTGVDNDEKILTVTQKNVIDYLQYLINEKELEASTRNTYLTPIKQFYKYLLTVCKLQIDKEILEIEAIDCSIKKAIFLDEVEAYQLLGTVTDVRSQAIVRLLLRTGIRIEELINIELADMEKETDDFGYHYYKIKIRGKGDKERYIYTDNETAIRLDKYIVKRREKTLKRLGITSKYLFVSNRGNQMDASNIRKMTKYCGRLINFKDADKLSPHKLRHTYATLMLNAEKIITDKDGNKISAGKKYDIKTVSESLGHTNIQTTNRYTHTTDKRISDMQRDGW